MRSSNGRERPYKFSNEIYNYDNLSSRTQSQSVYDTEELIVFMLSGQKDRRVVKGSKFLKKLWC